MSSVIAPSGSVVWWTVPQLELVLEPPRGLEAPGADVDSQNAAGAVAGEDNAEDARPAARVQDGFPLDLLRRKEHGPVLLGLLILGEVFRPDDIVEASDFLFVQGFHPSGPGPVPIL
jgi:hypothetical protein